MVLSYLTLNKETFDRLQAEGTEATRKYVYNNVGDAIHLGYGYYGFQRLAEENGQYRAYYWRGSTCD